MLVVGVQEVWGAKGIGQKGCKMQISAGCKVCRKQEVQDAKSAVCKGCGSVKNEMDCKKFSWWECRGASIVGLWHSRGAGCKESRM